MTKTKRKITECPICHSNIDLKDLAFHLKQVHPDLSEEELMKFLSTKFKIIESNLDLKDLKEEEIIVSRIKITAAKVWTFPPLDFYSCVEPSEEEDPNKEMLTQIADREVAIGKGYLILNEAKSNADALEKLNDVASLFNLIGVPIDFFNLTDLIILAEIEKSLKMQMVCSKMAFRRNSNVPMVVLDYSDLTTILLACNEIWKKFQQNDFIKETRLYEFLGRARLDYFNRNYRFAFINSWIVIEAILREWWEKKIIEKYGSKNSTKNMREDSRSWTINVITEELFLMDSITLEEVREIRKLRQKRNDLFHFKSTKKNKISQEDTSKCIVIGLKLLMRESEAFKGEKIVDMTRIRKKIFSAIHESENIQ